MTKSIRHCFRLPLPEFRLARSSMKGEENSIPYIENILRKTLIEHDVILWVLVNHVMTRDVLKVINLLQRCIPVIMFC